MAAPAVENPVPVTGESKSARKKKAKAEAANTSTNGTGHPAAAVPADASKDDSVVAEADSDHPYLKELQKQIRNINKKLTAMQKLDSVLAENQGVSLDDLVAQRKINTDQKAAALKKPQLQAQLAELEERQEHYRKFDSDYQVKFSKQRDELASQHQQELEKVKQELRAEATSTTSHELRSKLLLFSQFLRAAAAKRTIEEDADTDESKAFEGALLLVYGGDDKAVDTAINLIEGSDEQVPSIEGSPLPVTYANVKQASIDHAPFQTEEAWVDQVAEATGGDPGATDPTQANASLTELQEAQTNGIPDEGEHEPNSAAPVSAGGVGNVAGERWDTDAAGTSGGAEKGGLEESYEIIARPSEEVEVPAEANTISEQPQSTSWADEPQEVGAGVGNEAGEGWDVKAPGEADNSWAAEAGAAANGWADGAGDAAAAPADDGFHQVPGRNRGRGGRGRGGDGEFRGRGGRRGNFRGGFRGDRGNGEFRGRGRGRGAPRGGADAFEQ
ncbi:hypothetical protein M409DRAFT_65561 [Zasmidium cellare ATCC 36951]|uniref:YAG7-like dimerisation domain-containing protein n=1 Tax=Zasmidium cellare ATCC 36951 TaxID=1080233 RepID=A0A6A6CL67_ZASCE|nr:uncharacterized protein M409DRAFT_65561 [Zasmidium cellare ATCC 36951]KAF2167997.1 hypothetical protein M409DRAFT_65561 [Zasmidium cellare ATCC 36951]